MEMTQTAQRPKRYWWRKTGEAKQTCAIRYRPGQPCPQCQKNTLAYDGLFMLTCSACGYVAESGAFT